MNPSQRLKPIKKLADNKEKTAAQTLGKSVQNQTQQQQKLAQLINYRREYVENMSFNTQQGMSGEKLQQYHQFLSKLDTAIKHQESVVSTSGVTVDQSRKNWKQDNSRASAIGKVMNNMKNKESIEKNKRESAQIDEMSTQAFIRSKQR